MSGGAEHPQQFRINEALGKILLEYQSRIPNGQMLGEIAQRVSREVGCSVVVTTLSVPADQYGQPITDGRRSDEIAYGSGHSTTVIFAGYPIPEVPQRDTGVTMDNMRDRLIKKFEWIEAVGCRVASIWLSPTEAAQLTSVHDFDKFENEAVRAQTGFVGYLWGASAFESKLVPVGHIAVIPDGFDAKLTGSAGCMKL